MATVQHVKATPTDLANDWCVEVTLTDGSTVDFWLTEDNACGDLRSFSVLEFAGSGRHDVLVHFNGQDHHCTCGGWPCVHGVAVATLVGETGLPGHPATRPAEDYADCPF